MQSRQGQEILLFSKNVRTGSWTSYSVRSFPEGRGVRLTTHLHQVSKLRMCGTLPPPPIYPHDMHRCNSVFYMTPIVPASVVFRRSRGEMSIPGPTAVYRGSVSHFRHLINRLKFRPPPFPYPSFSVHYSLFIGLLDASCKHMQSAPLSSYLNRE